jgi:hypothetical protein
MGQRRRRDGNHSPQKNNSIQDKVGNEENGYPVSDPNKIMINVTQEPSDIHKKSSKKKSWEKSLRNSWRRYQTWLNRMCKMHKRNFKTPKINNMIRHRNK